MSASRHIVFGTAGHVDHGKSALVRALTGTDPDRLAEEKAREMTIDLGFAFLSLPGLERPAAIVDVPGHEMFVRNMVAGATGIDAAIFLVAADEGVMPQTIEHLRVLCYLKIASGVIALTKADRSSPERIARVSGDVRGLVTGSFLEQAAIVPVSAVTGEGLADLRSELARIALAAPTKSVSGPFRLPIDRVFTIRGAGTVVTGTVVSGSLRTGERVAWLPQDRLVRARMLQVHNEVVEEISAGQRAAINLPDIGKHTAKRGDVLVTPGSLTSTYMLDARVSLGGDAPRPIEQRTRVRVHHGTAEVMARVVLLESDVLNPGGSALAQLRLESPLVAASGDPFVLRSYSPTRVVGGGVVVDPHPPKRARAAGAQEVAERERLPTVEIVLELLDRAQGLGVAFAELQTRCGLSEEELRAALDRLSAEGRAAAGRRGVWFSAAAVGEAAAELIASLSAHHYEHPILSYAPLNAIMGAAAARPEEREACRLALESLARSGSVVLSGDRVRLATHQPQWRASAAAARDAILGAIRGSGLAVPSPRELAAECQIGEDECQEILDALVDAGSLTVIAAGIYADPSAVGAARDRVVAYLRQHPRMSIGDARDLLGASRRYLLPFLEQLDREGITLRQGDYRVLAGPRTAR